MGSKMRIIKLLLGIVGILTLIFLVACTNMQSNNVPVVNAGENIYVSVGESFNFAGSASDSDGEIVSFEWDADGDGTYDTFCKNCGKDGYTFDKPGTYTAKLKVTDNEGAIGTDEITILVQ